MSDIAKINNDFATLFQQGKELLEREAGAALNSKREDAFQRFQERGGVPYKTEDYLYTNLLPVFDKDYNVVLKYSPQEVDLNEIFQCEVSELDTELVLTINGWFYKQNRIGELPEGVIISSLQEASVKYPDLLEKHYDQYTLAAKNDGLIPLNTAFAQDGVFVYIPEGVTLERPIQIVNLLRSNTDLMGFQRNLIIVENNASATVLICEHTLTNTKFLINNVTEVYLGQNANLRYYQVQNQHSASTLLNSVFASGLRDSVFDSNLVTLYGGLIRNNLFVALNEEGAHCNLYGIYILDKNQQVDNFSLIDHIAPNCTSNEHFKGVLDDASLANFTGCIRVEKDAQKTQAYQANNNLLLTNTARINAKPQLIIDADDVKCSHGATVGQIDEEAKFYLRSRGIGEDEARMMLMFGFAHDIIQHITLEPLRERIDELVNKRFRGEFSKCHNCILQCKK